jgi:hypothetical protein
MKMSRVNFSAIAIGILGFGLVDATTVYAQNVGKCGWGSKLFEGNEGIAPQVLAVTTNGFLGNQTFGITSGTSGCTQQGVVQSAWKSVMFIEQNKTLLARDMAIGNGETLVAFANLIGISEGDKTYFYETTKRSFKDLFPSEKVTAGDVVVSLRTVLAEDLRLQKYVPSV